MMSESSQEAADETPPEVVAAPQLPQVSVGAVLREAREQSGMSMNEVSSRIKFAPRQIEALEADDYAHLPEITFVRGFVRSYARLLALDEQTLLAALPQASTRPAPEEANVLAEVPFPNTYSTRKPNIMWLGAALGVAVVLGIFVWLHGGVSDAPESPANLEQTLELPDATPMTAEPEAPTPMETAAAPMPPMATQAPMSPVPTVVPTTVKPAPLPVAPAPVAKSVPVKPAESTKPATPVAPVAKSPAPGSVASGSTASIPVAPNIASAAVASAPGAQAAKPAAAPVRSLPVTAPNAAPKPAEAKPLVAPAVANAETQGLALIHFTFDNESWVEVKDKNGKPLLGQLNAQGTELNVRGEPPFTLLIGNSGGVRLTYKGKSIDLAPHSSAQVAHLTLE